jgi:hypothetical protein
MMTTEFKTCESCGVNYEARFKSDDLCPACFQIACDATADEMTTCDFCEAEISQAEYDEHDGLCQHCTDTTIVCEECCDRINKADAHKTHGTLCEGCGDAKDEEAATEALDAAKEELHELVDELVGTDDIDAITAAVAALKSIAK